MGSHFSNSQDTKMTDSVLTVVGGRMVLSKVSSPQSSHSSFPLTGQQVMLQLDQMTSRMMDMVVTTEGTEQMETQQSQTQHSHQHQQEALAQQHNPGLVSVNNSPCIQSSSHSQKCIM